MDNLTHALHGFALAAVASLDPAIGQNPEAMSAVLWAASLGSQAPDFDFVIRVFGGNVAYLRHHRGISHSVPAWFVWPTLLAGVLSLWYPGFFGLMWVWSFYGVLVHVWMDLLTTYGTTAFWPFLRKRIGWDVLMIVDLVLWALGLLGLYLWYVGWSAAEVLLWTGLPASLYLALRVGIHLYLRWQVRRRYGEQGIRRISIIPFIGLLRWNLVVETAEEYWVGEAHLRKGLCIEQRFPKRERHVFLEEAQRSKVYRTFRWWARHLHVETQERDDGSVQIDLVDLTYWFRDRINMSAHLVLDREGRLLQEYLGKKSLPRKQKTHNVE
jgi:inner membrane protein